jgi:hypothetical protein
MGAARGAPSAAVIPILEEQSESSPRSAVADDLPSPSRVGKLIMYEGQFVGSASELLRPHPGAAAEGAPPGATEVLQRLTTGLQAAPDRSYAQFHRRGALRGPAARGPASLFARLRAGDREKVIGVLAGAVSICFKPRSPRVRVPSAPPKRPFGTSFFRS